MKDSACEEPYGRLAPSGVDRIVIAATSALPDTWLGLRTAIGLRRISKMRLNRATAFDVERWGMRLRLYPWDNGCEKNLLFTPRMYEAVELQELLRAIEMARASQRPFVFIDIGANVGLFSLFVAAHADRKARIVAIEPSEENFRRLVFNASLNNCAIEAKRIALGDEECVVEILPDATDRGGTKVRASSDGSVACTTLPSLVEAVGIERIDAIKIDAEGWEDRILLPLFENAPEAIWPALLVLEDQRGTWSTDLLTRLPRLGYRLSSRTRLNAVFRRGY